MRKQYVRAYFDATGSLKHIQESDDPITSEVEELDNKTKKDLLAEVDDFVVERNDIEAKPNAREILGSINANRSPVAKSRLSGMTIRDPNEEESKSFGATEKQKRKFKN